MVTLNILTSSLLPQQVQLTQSRTDLGAASYHIGGTTLHHFLGCGLAEEGVLELKLKMSPRAIKQLEACRILIIDEISMVTGPLLQN
jgi:PIF1-like helicase